MGKDTARRSPVDADRRIDLQWFVAQLRRAGWLGADEAEIALRDIKPGHPITRIAAHQFTRPQSNTPLSTEALTQWLARHAGLPYYRVDPLKIDVAAVTALVPYAYAARNRLLPVAMDAMRVTIATAEPYMRGWESELRHALKRDIVRVVANPADIERYVVDFYALSRSVKHAGMTDDGSGAGDIANLEQLVELGRSGKLDANDQHVVTIVDWLLQYAFDQRASDIHLEPRRDSGTIRFRIDGVLHPVYQMPAPVMAAVTSRIKILGRMDLAEKRRPLDGRLKTKSPEGKEIELRLATMPTAFGEKLVMRIFDPEVLMKGFSELGFDDAALRSWRAMVEEPHGIILVTGPTGSGKTTTLYSTLRQLATSEVNVCTIEDPIEMVEPAFNQMQTHAAIGLDFAAGVRALLRQDPDIIMIGEIRDRETAEMAVQAASTGHLVLSTLHTNDAPSAVTRLLELGVPAYLLNSTLLGVIAQRLVRRLCPSCRRDAPVDASAWEAIGGTGTTAPAAAGVAVGCLDCRNTGYRGRVGIYEILTLTPMLRKAIRPATDAAELRCVSLREGMRPLAHDGLAKVNSGLTTLAEIARAVSTGKES